MACVRCKRKSSTEYCDRCFVDILERAARRTLRGQEKRILVFDSLTKGLVERPGLELIQARKKDFGIGLYSYEDLANRRLAKYLEKEDAVAALPITMDLVLSHTLKEIFSGRKPKKAFFGRIIPVLIGWTNEDLAKFCRLKKLKIKSSGNVFLDKMEKHYPGTKRSMLASLEAFR